MNDEQSQYQRLNAHNKAKPHLGKVIRINHYLGQKRRNAEVARMRHGLVIKMHQTREQYLRQWQNKLNATQLQDLSQSLMDLTDHWVEKILYSQESTLNALNDYWQFRAQLEQIIDLLPASAGIPPSCKI